MRSRSGLTEFMLGDRPNNIIILMNYWPLPKEGLAEEGCGGNNVFTS